MPSFPQKERKSINKVKISAVVSTSIYFQKAKKSFKKESIKKGQSFKSIFDGRDSLNRYMNSHNITKIKSKVEPENNEEVSREKSCGKITRIEQQIRKHCLKKKQYFNEISTSHPSPVSMMKNSMYDGLIGSFKTEMSEISNKQEEGETRNTSKEYDKGDTPKILFRQKTQPCDLEERESQLDSSFAYADLDLGEKKESGNFEARVSEKMTTKIYKSITNNFWRIFKRDKPYGCDCGDPNDPKLTCCIKAEEWLKYAFQGSPKEFGAKDQKVFKELIEMDVRKESKAATKDDDRIALTVCIENDLKRTFPNDKFFQSTEAKNTLYDVLKAYTLYDNKCGYVQGMNFIAASLIYHSSPDIAFWLFVSLIFDYQLRENYKSGFPGVENVNKEILKILEYQCPNLAKLFKSTETDFGMFTLEIIMSLFGIAIPLNLTGEFYDNFFKNGWNFFVRLIIAFLEEIQDILLKLDDPWCIIRTIKAHTNPHLPSTMKYCEDEQIKIKQISWGKLIKNAEKIK